MKQIPLKNKGVKITKIFDIIIKLFEDNTKLLQDKGLPVYIKKDEILKLKKSANKEFGNKKLYEEEDIKSAIEWLKEKIKEGKNRRKDSFGHKNLTTEGILDWINKTFEDIK